MGMRNYYDGLLGYYDFCNYCRKPIKKHTMFCNAVCERAWHKDIEDRYKNKLEEEKRMKHYIEKLAQYIQDRDAVVKEIKSFQVYAEQLLNQKLIMDSKISTICELTGKSEEELQKELDRYAKEVSSNDINDEQLELFDDKITTDKDSGDESDADCGGCDCPAPESNAGEQPTCINRN